MLVGAVRESSKTRGGIWKVKHKTKTKRTTKAKHGIGSKAQKFKNEKEKDFQHSYFPFMFLHLTLSNSKCSLFHNFHLSNFHFSIFHFKTSCSVSWRAKGQNIRHNQDPSEVREGWVGGVKNHVSQLVWSVWNTFEK